MVIFINPNRFNEPIKLTSLFKIADEAIFKFKSFKFVQILKFRPALTRLGTLERDNFVTFF